MTSDSVSKSVAAALDHHRAGRLDEAEATYRQILKTQPKHPNVLHLLGVVAYQRGKNDLAITLISDAVSIDPAIPEFHNNLAEALRAAGKLEDAVPHYRRALTLKPDYSQAYVNWYNAIRGIAQLPASGPRVAVITPYFRETEDVLRRCHESVLGQSYPCVHFLVADGHPADFLKSWDIVHSSLSPSHNDGGCTPRAVGSLSAVNQGFDAIAYLDADNWYSPDHIASLVRLHTSTGAAVCTSSRTFNRADGSVMPITEPGDGTTFVDTSCLFLTRAAFGLVPTWALMPKPLSPIGDRVFWQAVKSSNLPCAATGRATVAFQTRYEVHYRALHETPPADAKPADCQRPGIEWWKHLSNSERMLYESIMGFTLHIA